MNRDEQLQRLRTGARWDVAVIGGGATGLGVALDAAARGFEVALIEADDFAKGTSSRATKLLHGGVRYLAQGNLALVREALRERAVVLANAPHLAQPLAFVMPSYRWWETPVHGAGLKAYDALAGRRGLGPTRLLSRRAAQDLLPTLRGEGLRGGVQYWDAQFDDARLAVALARSAVEHGAAVLNHCPAAGLVAEGGRVAGVLARDAESGETLRLHARCVVNATGVWVDRVRAMDAVPDAPPHCAMVAPSQGIHVVVDRSFLPGGNALIVPKTADGRVLFAVPWLGKTLLGTTDTPRRDMPREPRPLAGEVDFVLREAGRYLAIAPRTEDVRSTWAGLRPLVRDARDVAGDTRWMSREHSVAVASSGLVTVTGGKWTTYRAMAEDVLARCFAAGLLPARPGGITRTLPLAGAPRAGRAGETEPAGQGGIAQAPGTHLYGSDAPTLDALPGATRWLWRDGAGGLSEAMVRFAARHEMARTVEDVLARRSRLLFLDAAQAKSLAWPVARILAEELRRPVSPPDVEAFEALASRYLDPLQTDA